MTFLQGFSFKQNLSRIGLGDGGKHTDKGRFTRTIRAQQSVDTPLRNGQIDVFGNALLPKGFTDVDGFNNLAH